MEQTKAQRIGDNIRAEMARKRVTQGRLADMVGLTQTRVSARIRGDQDWGITELIAVAAALHVTVADLLAGTQDGVA